MTKPKYNIGDEVLFYCLRDVKFGKIVHCNISKHGIRYVICSINKSTDYSSSYDVFEYDIGKTQEELAENVKQYILSLKKQK